MSHPLIWWKAVRTARWYTSLWWTVLCRNILFIFLPKIYNPHRNKGGRFQSVCVKIQKQKGKRKETFCPVAEVKSTSCETPSYKLILKLVVLACSRQHLFAYRWPENHLGRLEERHNCEDGCLCFLVLWRTLFCPTYLSMLPTVLRPLHSYAVVSASEQHHKTNSKLNA